MKALISVSDPEVCCDEASFRVVDVVKTFRRSRARVVFPLDEGPDIPTISVLFAMAGVGNKSIRDSVTL